MPTGITRAPRLGHESGWPRLWRHSYRLGARWALDGAAHRWSARRLGLNRLLVPLDPWRYFELGRLVDEPFPGRWLDVSSPKLLPSLLQREGRGEWVAVDLFSEEVEAWRVVDPTLDLRVEDARALSFEDASFDGCLCVSVLEHVTGEGDADAMAEMWRVLRPGGLVRLTTNVAASPREVTTDREFYGEATATTPEGATLFERHYSAAQLGERLLGLPWEVLRTEYVRQRDPAVHERFFAHTPWSYALGGALRFVCPRNFARVDSPDDLAADDMAVVYMELRKPRSA
jgi:SAM-dependent methyltransferase